MSKKIDKSVNFQLLNEAKQKDLTRVVDKNTLIECPYHQSFEITNICLQKGCLEPLCPECVKIHLKLHYQQNTSGEIDTIFNKRQECIQSLQITKNEFEKDMDILHNLGNKFKGDLHKSIQKKIFKAKEKIQIIVNQYFEKMEQEMLKNIENHQYTHPGEYKQINQRLNKMVIDLEKKLAKLHSSDYLKTLLRVLFEDMNESFQILKQEIEEGIKLYSQGMMELELDDSQLYKIAQLMQNYASLTKNIHINDNNQIIESPKKENKFLVVNKSLYNQSGLNQFQEPIQQLNQNFIHFFPSAVHINALKQTKIHDQQQDKSLLPDQRMLSYSQINEQDNQEEALNQKNQQQELKTNFMNFMKTQMQNNIQEQLLNLQNENQENNQTAKQKLSINLQKQLSNQQKQNDNKQRENNKSIKISAFYQSSNQYPKEKVQINLKNYFQSDCQQKFIFFFQENTRTFSYVDIDEINQKKIEFKNETLLINFKIPMMHKSIITPQGHIFMSGGLEQDSKVSSIANFYQLQFKSKILDPQPPMKFPRSLHGICYINNCIYVVGGLSDEQQGYLSKCERFEMTQKKWQLVSDCNLKTIGCTLSTFQNRYIFKFGGISTNSPLSDIIERYDVFYNKWIAIKSQSQGMDIIKFSSFSAACQINSTDLIIFGGNNNEVDISDVYIFKIYEENLPQDEQNNAKSKSQNKNIIIGQLNRLKNLPQTGSFSFVPLVQENILFAELNVQSEIGKNQQLSLQQSQNIEKKRVVLFNGVNWSVFD